ncbi:MAG: hypothetical protein ABI426_07755 [Flavobacterium sp.]
MFKKNIKTLSLLLSIIVVFYTIHKSVFVFLKYNTESFQYSLETLYLFFSLFSVAIVLVLIKVKQKDLDLVGNVFLLATFVKMLASFFVGRPILKYGSAENSFEKWNFLTLFGLFLFAETFITIRMLNEKKED